MAHPSWAFAVGLHNCRRLRWNAPQYLADVKESSSAARGLEMKPDDWTYGIENEAASVNDAVWAEEARRTLRREHLKQLGLTALATLLVFQLLTLIPASLDLSGVRFGTVYSVLSNTQELIFITGLALWLGRQRLPLWPMPVVGLLASRLIMGWPIIALGWTTWSDYLAPLAQSSFWWETLLKLPLPLLYVVAFYFIGQRWPRRKVSI